MNSQSEVNNYAKQKKLIKIVSIVIPLAVAALFSIEIEGYDFSFLPKIYTNINLITAIVLLFALWMAKKGNVETHEVLIKVCMALSLVFLLMYIVYHATSGDTKYGGDLGLVYYPILISHIILSIGVVPLVLYSYLYGSNGKIEEHRKLVKKAFPIWLYVAVSGVVVYIMISPYY